MLITRNDPQCISFVKKCLSEQFMMSDWDHSDTSWGLRSHPRLMATISLSNRSTFRILSIVLDSHIIALLRLLWSSIFSFVLQTVSLLRIQLAIVIYQESCLPRYHSS
uniref:Uncharacterized protein n=1 Tax=Arundo donax TaxID=35708 RepID=A0A0A9GP88_ARUDO